MKNILCILALLAFQSMPLAQELGWYNGKESPYIISTEADLIGLQQQVSNSVSFDGKIILLANNIVLTSSWMPIGDSIRPFKGTLDGQGKTISGLTVYEGYGERYVNSAGLFGYVGEGGQIKNLNVEAATIVATWTGSYAGGLAARYASTKPIENCSVKADSIISYSGYGSGLGGLVGRADSALIITNSYTSVNVYVSDGSHYGGGLVGYALKALTITNSYASGNVTATSYGNISYGGGLVGYASETSVIENCYASGNISRSGSSSHHIRIGGIFGSQAGGTYSGVYYNSGGGASIAAGEGSFTDIFAMSSTELKKQETYIGWDFNEIWDIVEGISYPTLKKPQKMTAPISGGLEAEYFLEQTYTGSQITPEPIVRRTSDNTVLTKDEDYALEYGENKDAGTGTVTIVGINGNSLRRSIYFDIIPKTLTVIGAQVTRKTYDGTTEAAITGATLAGVWKDDDVSISNLTGAFATANIGKDIAVSTNMSLSGTAAENYSITQPELKGTISPKNLPADAIQAIASPQTYTGSEITPSITVMDGSNILAIDTDYTLSIIENINVGTASVSIAGIGNYAGALDTTFEILPKELSNSMIAAIADQQYTGEEITPDITVSDGNRILVEGTDYEVSYSNNVNAGSASASITGKGNYAGEASPIAKTFAINPKALTIIGAQVTGKIYDGTRAAEITGTPILEGVFEGDIENVSISSITGTFATANAGTEIEVSINASLSGAAAANYSITQPELKGTITAKPLAEDAIQAIASQTYTGSAITPSVTVKDGSNILAVGSDYTLYIINNTNTGTASVLVTGKGNYKGTANATFTITESTPIRTPQIAASQIRAQSAANAIMLQNLPQNAKIEAYNLQGKWIYMGNSVNSQILRIAVQTKGIYVIKISLGSQKQILKVPVK